MMLGAMALGGVLGAQAGGATAFSFAGNGAASAGTALDAGTTDGVHLNVYGGMFTNAGLGTVYAEPLREWGNAGLGVMSSSETTANGSHQIDNNAGIDFVLFDFDKSVTLDSVTRANYSGEVAHPVTGFGTDASILAYTGSISSLFGSGLSASDFTTMTGTNTGSSKTGNLWLVAANVRDTNDAFKISRISLHSPSPTGSVPEPASWAMMIVGFGAVGTTMRRRKTKTLAAA